MRLKASEHTPERRAINSMDQPANGRELAGEGKARRDEREAPNGKHVERRAPFNRAAKQRMERELRAQGLSPEAIARLLHLGV